MYHWIRDCAIDVFQTSYNHGNGETNYIYYHFLRVAGWSLIWECDGDADTHCTDANMEDAGTTSWTAVGSAMLAKSTSQKHMGAQALQITSMSSGDGARSAALVSMTGGRGYHLTFWAYNDTGQAWDVQVDTGTGSFSSVGTIPSDGVWAQHTFSFTTNASGTPYFQVLDTNATIDTIYLDSIFLRDSWFEYSGVMAEDLSASPDGQILNSNEFHSGSYSFQASDIGRHICVWDPTNVGNSGVYEITSLNGSDAQLDLRAGGTPALVAQTGLRWRMVDVAVGAPETSNNATSLTRYAGWGLESPHSEKWRLFIRNNWKNVESWMDTWCAPYDADFDVETGLFLNTEISTLDARTAYQKGIETSGGSRQYALEGSSETPLRMRVYLQTDDTGSFVILGMRSFGNGFDNFSGWVISGFTGSDSYHTLRESFVNFAREQAADKSDSPLRWSGNGYNSVPYNGVQVDDFGMVRSYWMLLGYGANHVDVKVDWASTGRVNPFGPSRILLRPKIARDFYGYTTRPTEKLITTMGLWDGYPDGAAIWTAVESNTMLVVSSYGVFLEMPSSGGVGLFEPLT